MPRQQTNIEEMVSNIIKLREDLSPYLVHLTRDFEGNEAKDNLISMLNFAKIEARNVDAYFKYSLKQEFKKYFKVLSLTETPLKQLHHLTKIPYKRKINLKPYGIAFPKSDLINKNAAPVYYIYNEQQKNFFDHLLENFIESMQVEGAQIENSVFLSVGPFLKRIYEREDFHWEKEWKVRGDLLFDFDNIVIIVPNLALAKEIYEKTGYDQNIINFYLMEENEWRFFIRSEFIDRDDGTFVYIDEVYSIYEEMEIEVEGEPEFSMNTIETVFIEEIKVPRTEFYSW